MITPQCGVEMDSATHWKTIEAKILSCAQHLRKQGTICKKMVHGKAVWRLRFVERNQDGRSIHRSIRIGSDPELADRARRLLSQCRMRGQWLRELRAAARLTGTAVNASECLTGMKCGGKK